MRIPSLALIAAAVLACAAAPAPYRYVPAHDDKSIGSPSAPVTVIEYGSVACPHCAAWDRDVFPAFKKKYIDTGKVRFVFREMLTGDPSLAAAGFVTARCAPPNKYFDVVHAIMRQQDEIYRGRQIRPPLIAIAKGVGLSEEKLTACLNDPHNLTAANTRSDLNAAMDSVDGTPAFVVNGIKLDGEQTLEQLDKAISSAPPAAKPAALTKTPASASAPKPAPKKK
ncbi:MAG TPA: DsbA family protein [Caulobacteraceae bacterium]|nr:DsbA family protein [Caulobacteraceae bacterium]